MRVIRQIDRGSFGRVEEVQLNDGSIVARKVFDPDPALVAIVGRQHLIDRFKREVKIQSSLSGDFVIPILQHNLNDPDPYFLMPLADRNFETEIAQARTSGQIPEEALADIINGLEELHKQGITHRDLTPRNILFHDSIWKLSDFGLVMPPRGAETTLTSTGATGGTPNYCAPEQAIDFKHTTEQADIYAFGCILHDCVSAHPRVPYVRQTCPGLLGTIIEKCTEYALDRRFKTIGAVRTVLFTNLAKVGVTVSAGSGAAIWIAKLPDIPSWTDHDIIDFIRFIKNTATDEERAAVFTEIDDKALSHSSAKNEDLWLNLVEQYCLWAQRSFPFALCDVIVTRLEFIFDQGSLECKALAAVSAAELGSSHNRFFVMKRVLEMCAPSITEEAAQRIGIEMVAQDKQIQFWRCASGLNRTVDSYHPKIRDLIIPVLPPPPVATM